MIYAFERKGRRPFAIVAVALIWAILAVLYVVFDMSLWITGFLLAFTLPALWDIIRDRRARVEVWPSRLVWSAAYSEGKANDIDHVRLNRRFDGWVKVTIVHVGGATTRLPPDIGPPVDAFENALGDAGISAQRHPFSVL